VAVRRQDLEAADRYYARALAILESAHRGSVDYARIANALAVVAAARRQSSRAQQLYDTAIAIYEAQRPESLELAQVLANLAVLQMTRGEPGAAETLLRRALAIKTARNAPPADVGAARANLGLVLADEGRLADAAAEFKAAIDLRRAQAPPLELAALLSSQARVERLRGNADAAAAAAREALDLGRAQAPGTLLVAEAATELGLARESSKAFDEASALYREALAIREKAAPGSTDVAHSLERIASVTAATGDVLSARNAFERAVDAWSRASPGSLDHVHVVHALGQFLIERGETDEGLRRLREAVDLLEKAPAELASPKLAWGLRASQGERLQTYYGSLMRLLADRGDAGEAFTLLDRLHEQLRRARCDECGPATTLEPLEALRQGIETGTLVIAYSVQPSAAYAFVGRREVPVRVYRIDVKAEALAERARRLIDRVRAQASASIYESPVVADGRALFELLFGQFADEIRRADRLLIVPDGPLELVPFSALARPTSRVSWQYLVDWKPLVFAPSVSLAAAWAAGTAAPTTLAELRPTAEPGTTEARIVGTAPAGGALVALWSPPEDATAQLTDLFTAGIAPTRSREFALMRAQRILRDERGRTHPIYWAAFRYYGPRGVP
jgi:tetratricopeptide (TPR) repeat protein